MDVQTIIQILGLLGIGGIIGGFINHIWKQKEVTELRIQELNETKYRSILVYMRLLLKPENLSQFHIDDPKLLDLNEPELIKKYIDEKLVEHYYNSILYASDNVLKSLKQFMKKPTESNFVETAMAMRKDLWKKSTKLDISELE